MLTIYKYCIFFSYSVSSPGILCELVEASGIYKIYSELGISYSTMYRILLPDMSILLLVSWYSSSESTSLLLLLVDSSLPTVADESTEFCLSILFGSVEWSLISKRHTGHRTLSSNQLCDCVECMITVMYTSYSLAFLKIF